MEHITKLRLEVSHDGDGNAGVLRSSNSNTLSLPPLPDPSVMLESAQKVSQIYAVSGRLEYGRVHS